VFCTVRFCTVTMQYCAVGEDPHKGIFVNRSKEVEVSSPQEAAKLRRIEATNRPVTKTLMFVKSSRSHSVFTLRLDSRVLVLPRIFSTVTGSNPSVNTE